MRTFTCTCGEMLFVDNTHCVACHNEAGFCPTCQSLVTLLGNEQTGYRCGSPTCGVALVKCHNYAVEKVCNHCIALLADGSLPSGEKLCTCCQYNDTIPDLNKPGNREKWRRLEAAKRRVFYQLDLLGLPHFKTTDDTTPSLAFDFKEDQPPDPEAAAAPGARPKKKLVMTGHLNGKITLNIREADPVEREKLSVKFGEPNRSLIGHFRHELAHYYWDLLIKGQREVAFKAAFGDHENPTYADALKTYYKQGPPADWATRHASAYASMHPWEDFAETFATYLEMAGTLDTAFHVGLGGPGVYADLDQMIVAYRKIGMAMNEMNRTMGLKDALTRSLVPAVVEKLRFIHQLVREVSLNQNKSVKPSPSQTQSQAQAPSQNQSQNQNQNQSHNIPAA